MQTSLLCRLQQVSWELQQSGEVRVQWHLPSEAESTNNIFNDKLHERTFCQVTSGSVVDWYQNGCYELLIAQCSALPTSAMWEKQAGQARDFCDSRNLATGHGLRESHNHIIRDDLNKFTNCVLSLSYSKVYNYFDFKEQYSSKE